MSKHSSEVSEVAPSSPHPKHTLARSIMYAGGVSSFLAVTRKIYRDKMSGLLTSFTKKSKLR